MLKWVKLWSVMLLLSSCVTKPEPIRYGRDACDYCRMTIMDPKFSGEIITKKGKVYKFDAVECLLDYYKAHQPEASHFFSILISDYSNPDNMLDVNNAFFLKDEDLRSPMGINIAAFSDETLAGKFGKGNGEILKWADLLKMNP